MKGLVEELLELVGSLAVTVGVSLATCAGVAFASPEFAPAAGWTVGGAGVLVVASLIHRSTKPEEVS